VRRRQRIAGQRSEQQRGWSTQKEHLRQVVDGLVVLLERLPHDGDEPLVLCRDRDREQAHRLVVGDVRVADHEVAAPCLRRHSRASMVCDMCTTVAAGGPARYPPIG
jgi:hypothetical protein